MSLNNRSFLFANNKSKNPWHLFKGFGMDICWICKSIYITWNSWELHFVKEFKITLIIRMR
jgi:hypothetical protein